MEHKEKSSQFPGTEWRSKDFPQLCVIQAGQTGDASHVAAAAALDDNTDILVIASDTKEETINLVTYFESVTRHAPGCLKRKHVRLIVLESGLQGEKVRHVALYNMMVDDKNGKRVDLKKLVDSSENKVRKLLLPDQTKVR